MRRYRVLENALDMFSEEVGVGVEGGKEFLEYSLSENEYRSALQRELLGALSAPDVDWVALLSVGRTVASPESQTEARAYVVELLWDQVFPGRPRPTW